MTEDSTEQKSAPKRRWPWAVAGIAVLLGAAAGGYWYWQQRSAPPLLALFPDDSYLVASLDVAAFRAGPLADLATETDATAKRRAEPLLGACAAGAVGAVREVGLVVPGGAAEEGSFALAARLDMAGPWAAACDAELAQRSATVPREAEGAWSFIGAKDGPRLALHRSGVALWGREPYLHTLTAAVFREGSERRYEALAARTIDAGKPRQAFAAITLPAEQRRVFAAVVEEQGRPDGHPELFAVARAGLALAVDAQGDTLQVTARFETDKPDAPAKLRATLEELLQKTSDSLEARALGASDALANARVVAADDAVIVTAAAPIGRLRMMAKRLRLLGEMRKLAQDAAERAPDAPDTPRAPAP
jgi:hypothetical protein